MKSNKFIKCPGCKAMVIDIDLPSHKYLGTIPGCWNIYSKVIDKTKPIHESNYIRELIVDTYSAQHPGKESAVTKQSLAIHLIRLYFFFELNQSLGKLSYKAQKVLSNVNHYHWLTPPKNLGKLTIVDVFKYANEEDQKQKVLEWAETTWYAWSQYHPIVKRWVNNGERQLI
jgi:hypothetical protein